MRKHYHLPLMAVPVTPGNSSTPEPWGETTVIGKALPRIDAYERVSGSAEYPRDVMLPDMLYAAVLRCPHAHAKVKKLDMSKAAKMPGVVAVLSDADPEAKIEWYPQQGPNSNTSRLFDPHCRYEGDEVAAVAAETQQQAFDALRAIEVEWEELPFVVDMEEALKPDAPKIHDGGNHPYPLEAGSSKRGDVAKGFAEADAIVERTFRTPCQIHTCMETHGTVAKWEKHRLTVWESTQGVYGIQDALAAMLKMPISNIRVIGKYMGGGFGSKFDVNKHGMAAILLAKKTGRPVKCFATREESFLALGNRPPHILTLKAGAKKDGTITAFQLKGLGTFGAYPEWTTTGHQVNDLYTCANVQIEEDQSYINAGKARAFRAPGFPQGNWALEQVMDELAEKIGMDPVEFRLKNIPTVSQAEGNQPYTSTGLAQCIREGAAAFGWRAGRAQAKGNGPWKRGVGMAAAQWGYGGDPPSTAIVKMFTDGSVNLNMGCSDLGTGTKTVMAMVVTEELGVPFERIQIEHADTATTQWASPSGGSKTVPVDSPAVRAAALEVKRQLIAFAAEQLSLPVADLALKGDSIVSISQPDKKVAITALKKLGEQQLVMGTGYRDPNPKGKVTRPFSAHFAEVEVNVETGETRILRMLAAQDSGRMMNRLTYENQVYGGIGQGIGFSMMEQRILDRQTGKMVNANWHDYKIPTAKDVPGEITVVPIDSHDHEANTTSTKGLGEPATIPTGAAIANAVYNAVGIRVASTPISPIQMARLLAEQKKRG